MPVRISTLADADDRRLLVALMVDADRPVPAGTPVERVWGGDPPPRVEDVLRRG